MTGRRRHGRIYLLGSLLLLAGSLHAPTAYSAPGDPPRGSPAGAVYELPFEQGRADAAPKGGGGRSGGGNGSADSGSGGGSQQDEAGSLYRTENNFGSSSRVPGLGTVGGDGRAGEGADSAIAGIGGSGGTGGGGAGGAPAADGAIAGQVTDAGNTSVPASIALLGAIALLAAGVAVLSRRFSQR